ncbi:MAG: DUF1573 domain-containing protein, partial [Nanoarchaeota archaeon]|nr:DUF1573 domain-containing protein [Nanoarchaeota archaeon]
DGNWVSDTLNYTVVSQYIDLKINFIKAIQVVEDVDLVAGKATAVKVNINNTNDLNQAKDVNVRVDFNDKNYYLVENFVGDHNFIFYDTRFNNYTESGSYIITAEVDPDKKYYETDEDNTSSITMNVVDTKNFKIVFRPVEEEIFNYSEFEAAAEEQSKFIKALYPIAEDEMEVNIIPIPYVRGPLDRLHIGFLFAGLFDNLYLGYLNDAVVGIIPDNWLAQYGYSGVDGLSSNLIPKAVLSEATAKHITAHEVGHIYELCDEYNGYCCGSCKDGNSIYSCNDCPNDYGINCAQGACDEVTCYGEPYLSGIYVNEGNEIVSSGGDDIYFSFMGSSHVPDKRWSSNAVYTHLLSKFTDEGEKSSTDSNILIVRGSINKNYHVNFMPFYIKEGQEFGSSDGNCSVNTIDYNGQTLNDYNFSLEFTFSTYGESVDFNNSAFTLGINFSEDINSIQIICDGQLKAEKFVSVNEPTVSITSPLGGEEWHTGKHTISWNADDLDEDILSYALQFSDNNGLTWNTVVLDLNETDYNFNAGMINAGGNQYKIKVIATDGILTTEDISGTFTILNPNITVEPNEWDLGTINNLQNVSQDFNIVNTGNADLNVFDMNVSDNLTVAGLSLPVLLEPEEYVSFNVELNVLDMNLGEFNEDINLGSNDPNQIVKRIMVYGKIEEAKPDFSVSADDINFSSIYPEEDENISVSALIRNLGDLNAENVNVKFYSDYPKELVSDEYTIG